jgi:hypothetical protein
MKIDQTFVALKYQLPTADNFRRDNLPKCQELLNTYPGEVVSNWAWRCAEDVEHLATTPETKEMYRIARLFRAGKATREELDKAWSAAHAAYYAAYHAAFTAYHAAFAYHAACAAYTYAAPAAAYHAAYAGTKDENIKWALYRTWLIEELSNYVEKR